LIIAGVPLQLTKILVPMAGDTKCSTVYKEAIINLQFNDPSNQQNLFRLLKNLKQQRNEQSFEEIWQAAEEAVRQLIKHQQSKNRNDRMILVFAGMLREVAQIFL
jgi:sugar (pentulose or hexulose) kinase